MKKIKFLKSHNVDVLIVDEQGAEQIMMCIPNSASLCILPVRNVIPLILHYSLILRIFMHLSKNKKIKDALLFSLIDVLKPKVLITQIDNSNLMSKIHKEFPNKLTISVQNGYRCGLKYPNGSIYPVSVNAFYGFGDYEKYLFKKRGIENIDYVGAGSLSYELYKKQTNASSEIKYDFCFISQFEFTDNTDNPHHLICDEFNEKLFLSLTKICKKFGFSLAVAMKTEISEAGYFDELELFTSIDVHRTAKLIPNNSLIKKSYEVAATSNILITLNSTLGFEFFGVGKKVLFGFSNPTFDDLWDTHGSFKAFPDMNLLNNYTVESMLSKLNFLIDIDENKYIEITKNARKYSMNYSDDRTPSKLIKDRISKFLLNNKI